MMPSVNSGSSEVADILTEIAAAAVAAGGIFSDQFEVRERDGELSGHSTGRSIDSTGDNRVLIELSDDGMPAVDAGEWAWSGEALTVETDSWVRSSWSVLLELHAQLYTATSKPRWFRAFHPRAAVQPDTPTHGAIRALRPGFTVDPSPLGFLSTRTYRRGEDRTPCLIPIADVLNHHIEGAPLSLRTERLVVTAYRPLRTSECFTNYGGFRRDPLDLALHYGYADSAVRVAVSAPLRLETVGFGDIQVQGLLPRAKSAIDPPTVTTRPDGLILSHLTLQADNPDRLVVPLTMIAKTSGARNPERAARELLGTVIERNLELIEALVGTLDPDSPMGAMLTTACGYQAKIFREVSSAVT